MWPGAPSTPLTDVNANGFGLLAISSRGLNLTEKDARVLFMHYPSLAPMLSQDSMLAVIASPWSSGNWMIPSRFL